MRCFDIRNFDSSLVDDPFVRVHKVKVTVHDRIPWKLSLNRRAAA
jgi:hypothetical protein